MLTAQQIQFIQEHLTDDLPRLLLSATKYPDLDIPFLCEQIAARRQIREKLPSWYANRNLVFPAKIAAEQCSSEQTALYKQRLVRADWMMCDLTGGLGIDSYFFSRKVKQLIYVERFTAYCEAAIHNFRVLGGDNIQVLNADATQCVAELPFVDAFYLDPARRGESNKRMFALSDCEPNLPELLPELLKHASCVIAKLSPMADIQKTLSLLPGTVAIHVLSVKNECKELLFVIERDITDVPPMIRCVNFTSEGKEVFFDFSMVEEQHATVLKSEGIDGYLYEPNASVLKAGAFKQVAVRYGVKKLHISSHLYTAKQFIPEFPGRIFQVEALYPFSGKLCKGLSKIIPQANITVRNFPLTVEELRKRTKIKDGGSVYLFATTLANGDKVVIQCAKPI